MRALFAGSFDPVTFGHLDIICRMTALVESLVVAVATNPGKQPLFSVDDRMTMLRDACREWSAVSVVQFHGLVVEAAREFGADVIIRGARDGTDFSHEAQMAHMNRAMTGVETLLLPASPDVGFISSTLVRDIARFGGDIAPFVPAVVVERMSRR